MRTTTDAQPIDINAVRADDQLISRIAAREHKPTNWIEWMLDAWVKDVDR